MFRSSPWGAWGKVCLALCGLHMLAGLAGPARAMTPEEAQTAWAEGKLASTAAGELTGAREAFLAQAASGSDSSTRQEAAYRAAICLYYMVRTDAHDASFDKEAGDLIERFPSSPHNDDLAFHQALICVDRGAWGFVAGQMGQFMASYPSSARVEDAAYYSASAFGELSDYEGFAEAAAAFGKKYPASARNKDLAGQTAKLEELYGPLPEAETLTAAQAEALWNGGGLAAASQAKLQGARNAFRLAAGEAKTNADAQENDYRAAMCLNRLTRGNPKAACRFDKEAGDWKERYPGGAHAAELSLRQAMVHVEGGVWSQAEEKLGQFAGQYGAAAAAGSEGAALAEEALFGRAAALHGLGRAEDFAAALKDFKAKYPDSALGAQLDWLAARPTAMDTPPEAYDGAAWQSRMEQYELFTKTWPSSPLAPEAAYQAVRCLWAMGREEAAASATAQFKADHPGHYRWPYLDYDAAQARTRHEDWAGAAAGFEAVWRSYPRSPLAGDALWQAAESFYWAKRDKDFLHGAQTYRTHYPNGNHTKALAFHQADLPFRAGAWADACTTLTAFANSAATDKDPYWGQTALAKAALCQALLGDTEGFAKTLDVFTSRYGQAELGYRLWTEINNRFMVYGTDWAKARQLCDVVAAERPGLPDLAVFRLIEGVAWIKQANQEEPAGDGFDADQARKEGAAALKAFLAGADRLLSDPPATLAARADYLPTCENFVCEALFYSGETAALAERAQSFAQKHAGQPVLWAAFTNWRAVAAYAAGKPETAASLFDEVIAKNVIDTNFHSNATLLALEWRLALARDKGDTVREAELAAVVRDRGADCPQRTRLCEEYRSFLENKQ